MLPDSGNNMSNHLIGGYGVMFCYKRKTVYATRISDWSSDVCSSDLDLVVRFAVKPTSSILTPRRSIDRTGAEVEVVTKGRHDPCVGIRAVPVGEAMMACVLLDHLMRHEAQCGPIRPGG